MRTIYVRGKMVACVTLYLRFDTNKYVTAANLLSAFLEPRAPGDGVSILDPMGATGERERPPTPTPTPIEGAAPTHSQRGGGETSPHVALGASAHTHTQSTFVTPDFQFC